MPSPESERRRYPRHRVHVRVLYFSKGQPRGVDAACDDISLGGVFLRTRRRGPSVGDRVSLLVTSDDTPDEIMVDGIVRRQNVVESPDDGTEQTGIGVEFVEVEPQVREALAKFLSDAGRPPTSPTRS